MPPRSRYERALPVNGSGDGGIIVGERLNGLRRLNTDLNARPMISNLRARFITIFCKTVSKRGFTVAPWRARCGARAANVRGSVRNLHDTRPRLEIPHPHDRARFNEGTAKREIDLKVIKNIRLHFVSKSG
jgi:hypothetical protein